MADDFSVAALTLQFKVSGEVQIDRQLRGVMYHLEDLSPAMERIADSFRRHMAQVFATQGATTETGAWAPLSPTYEAWKAKHYPAAGILTRRGDLARSLSQPGDPNAVREITPNSLTLGTSLKYGIYHQMGTGRGLPRRKIIDLPETIKTEWMHIVADHVRFDR